VHPAFNLPRSRRSFRSSSAINLSSSLKRGSRLPGVSGGSGAGFTSAGRRVRPPGRSTRRYRLNGKFWRSTGKSFMLSRHALFLASAPEVASTMQESDDPFCRLLVALLRISLTNRRNPVRWMRGKSLQTYEAVRHTRNCARTAHSAAVGQRLVKSVSILDRWSSAWEWVDRARAYDETCGPGDGPRGKERSDRSIGAVSQLIFLFPPPGTFSGSPGRVHSASPP
jgi:hypothetical protein